MKQHIRRAALLAALVFLPLVGASAGEAPVLGPKAVVSLVTQGPGDAVYFSFGHSALRVRDPDRNIDALFNYGVVYAPGGIEDPLFIARFVYGQLDYCMVAEEFLWARDHDRRVQNRVWTEQVLDLDNAQVNALWRFLLWNARPENMVYRYDFILDNCATRIPLAFDKALPNDIRLPADPGPAAGKSFHQLIDEYVRGRPLFAWAFYLVLGRAADRPVSAREATFLPDYLAEALTRAELRRDGQWRPLVASTGKVVDPINPSDWDSPWVNPAFLLWPLGLAAVAWTLRGFLRGRQDLAALAASRDRLPARLADGLFFLLLGLGGLVVWFLNFISTHAAVKDNLNVLWLHPAWLAVAVLSFAGKRPKWAGWLCLAGALLALAPLLAWPVWPQRQHPAMAPVLAALAGRALWQARGLLAARAGRSDKKSAVVR
jgi:hypothetical protein